jgi:Cu(I)/Ag(I) efflux system protein CusF
VVKAIDPIAKTITLDHGPVAALNWPAMVMTFKTGDVDLASIKPGDKVAFEFTSNGVDATLTKLDRQ